jgi:hypothetical protein
MARPLDFAKNSIKPFWLRWVYTVIVLSRGSVCSRREDDNAKIALLFEQFCDASPDAALIS